MDAAMFRKTIIMALIVMVSGGTILAKVPLDRQSAPTDTASQRILPGQAGPKQALRFKAPRAIHLRTLETERVQRSALG